MGTCPPMNWFCCVDLCRVSGLAFRCVWVCFLPPLHLKEKGIPPTNSLKHAAACLSEANFSWDRWCLLPRTGAVGKGRGRERHRRSPGQRFGAH